MDQTTRKPFKSRFYENARKKDWNINSKVNAFINVLGATLESQEQCIPASPSDSVFNLSPTKLDEFHDSHDNEEEEEV